MLASNRNGPLSDYQLPEYSQQEAEVGEEQKGQKEKEIFKA